MLARHIRGRVGKGVRFKFFSRNSVRGFESRRIKHALIFIKLVVVLFDIWKVLDLRTRDSRFLFGRALLFERFPLQLVHHTENVSCRKVGPHRAAECAVKRVAAARIHTLVPDFRRFLCLLLLAHCLFLEERPFLGHYLFYGHCLFFLGHCLFLGHYLFYGQRLFLGQRPFCLFCFICVFQCFEAPFVSVVCQRAQRPRHNPSHDLKHGSESWPHLLALLFFYYYGDAYVVFFYDDW